jgi:hypothetical protein
VAADDANVTRLSRFLNRDTSSPVGRASSFRNTHAAERIAWRLSTTEQCIDYASDKPAETRRHLSMLTPTNRV